MLLFSLLACSGSKTPPTPSTQPTQDQVQREELVAHVQELASDAYLGRGTLEPGLDKAAEYISKKYADFGLSPLEGHDDFLLPYTLYQGGWTTEQSITLHSDQEDIELPTTQWIPFPFSDSGAVSSDLIFAGYNLKSYYCLV